MDEAVLGAGPAAPPDVADLLGLADNDSPGPSSGSGEDTGLSGDNDVLPVSTPSAASVKEQLEAVARSLRVKGDTLAEREEWQLAVHEYTAALRYAQSKEEEALLLCSRSATLCSWSRHIRQIPAQHSESCAIFGHDPTHVTELALKDAEKALQLQPRWHLPYARQASALFLLERYSQAETALLEGLLLRPRDQELMQELAVVQALLRSGEEQQEQQQGQGEAGTSAAAATAGMAEGSRRTQSGAQKRQRAPEKDIDDFECTLCLKLLFEPVTTPCGHTFCKQCFSRTMDHGNKCPMCRTVLHVARELPVTVTLKNILAKSFPSEYADRATEEAAAVDSGGADALFSLPVFVMTALLPGEKMALNIFEPRYRLMVRRCMEGSRHFAMAQVDSEGTLLPVACEVEITECQPLPDGRYYIEVYGRRRVRFHRSWEQDGYRMASFCEQRDPVPEPSSTATADLNRLSNQVETLADSFLDGVRAFCTGRRMGRLADLLERTGDKPPRGNAEALSFWVARLLLVSTPDNDQSLRGALLCAEDAAARLRQEKALLEARLDGAGTGCSIM